MVFRFPALIGLLRENEFQSYPVLRALMSRSKKLPAPCDQPVRSEAIQPAGNGPAFGIQELPDVHQQGIFAVSPY